MFEQVMVMLPNRVSFLGEGEVLLFEKCWRLTLVERERTRRENTETRMQR